MTELEQYKKAYATLVGRVDTVIAKMEENRPICPADELTKALEEAEEVFLAGDPEDQ